MSSNEQEVGRGNMYVNMGMLKEALEIFTGVLNRDSGSVDAYMGRGTALALFSRSRMVDVSNMMAAINDFTSVIRLVPERFEAWRCRAQCLEYVGKEKEALEDLTQAIKLIKAEAENPDVFTMRAQIYYRWGNYRRALADFEAYLGTRKSKVFNATKIMEINEEVLRYALLYNKCGLCLNLVGRSKDAIKMHERAIELHPGYAEAYSNLGQSHKEIGEVQEALLNFSKAVEVDPKYASGYNSRGICFMSIGDYKSALPDFETAFKLDSSLTSARLSQANILMTRGSFLKAYVLFKLSKTENIAAYLSEICLYMHSQLDQPFRSLSLDASLDPEFKVRWCKRLPFLHDRPTLSSSSSSSSSIGGMTGLQYDKNIPDVDQKELSSDEKKLLEGTQRLGEVIQCRSIGFVKNERQHRMAGLAILDVAQTLVSIFPGPRKSWRSVYEIGVKWRQVSEPSESIFWIDQLSKREFKEGFGAHTAMIRGQLNVTRYYPQFKKAFTLAKSLIKTQHVKSLSAASLKTIENATDCLTVLSVMKKDFYVATECKSTLFPGKILEGTRLAFQAYPPEGVEFSIHTACIPSRWKEYDAEMAALWEKFLLFLSSSHGSVSDDSVSNNPTRKEKYIKEACDVILRLTYYWFNFMPLSRGTAAVGVIMMAGMFLSVGLELSTPPPLGWQLDWMAILTSDPDIFVHEISEWVLPAVVPSTLHSELPPVESALPTLRSVIQILNF